MSNRSTEAYWGRVSDAVTPGAARLPRPPVRSAVAHGLCTAGIAWCSRVPGVLPLADAIVTSGASPSRECYTAPGAEASKRSLRELPRALRLVAAIHDVAAIESILHCLGLETRAPPLVSAALPTASYEFEFQPEDD